MQLAKQLGCQKPTLDLQFDGGQVGFLKPNGFLANVLLTLFVD